MANPLVSPKQPGESDETYRRRLGLAKGYRGRLLGPFTPPEQRPGESDLDYRARLEEEGPRSLTLKDPAFAVQRLEDAAFLKAQEARRARLRRTLGASGRGTSIFTSPLGVPTPTGRA